MNQKEFLNIHHEITNKVLEKCKQQGLQCSVLENIQQPMLRRTVFNIQGEVYEVVNNGDSTTHRILGVINDE